MRPLLYPFAMALELLMLVSALACVAVSAGFGCAYRALDNAAGWLCAKAKLLPDATWYVKKNKKDDA